MPISTAEEFLSVLERSNLLSPKEFAEARQFAAENSDATIFAKTLARNQFLTFWQAGQLLAGRSTFQLGKYRLIDLLGRGGMGSVFLAEHVMMHRRVALKIIPRQIAKNPAALERFLAEARTIAALDHSNIVRAYSVDSEGDRYYLVMEYVDGLDLQRAVEAYGPLDCEAAVDCVRQAADGLAHAHARKMIHCDIKPSNLIVTEEGVVKILDMGLARLVRDEPGREESSDPEKQVLGTVDYLAPEQAIGSPDFNHRADIYALGCTMYFLLTGQPPFPGGSLAQRILKHQTQEPQEITQRRPDVPASLAAICKKMMAKDPADRYQTADEASEVLAAWRPEVPQPVKKPLPIKKIEPLEDLSAGSPWEQEFGEELKNMAGTAGSNEFGFLPGMSGKMPTMRSGSSLNLKQMLAGTRNRLILTSFAAAFLLVLLLAAILLPFVTGGNSKGVSSAETNVPEARVTSNSTPTPPPPPVPSPFSNPSPSDSSLKKPEPLAIVPQTSVTQTENPKEAVPPVELPAVQPEENTPTEPEQLPAAAPVAEPLKELAAAVELPEYSKTSNGGTVSLGKIHLDPQAKLQIELIGGDKVSKVAGKYMLQEDPKAAKSSAWIISLTKTDARSKALPLARLKLKGSELNFEWAEKNVGPAQANPLRNCGLSVTVGEANRFVQFRVPKNADPLKLDLENGTARVMLPVENLPDTAVLRLELQELKEPFPANQINPEVLQPPNKKRVEIVFNDPQFAIFSIRVSYDANKKNIFDMECWANLNLAQERKFKISTGANFLKEYQSKLGAKKNQLAAMKNNNPAKNDLNQQVNEMTKNLNQFTEVQNLAIKLNGQLIHYRIVADYEKYQVELYNSH